MAKTLILNHQIVKMGHFSLTSLADNAIKLQQLYFILQRPRFLEGFLPISFLARQNSLNMACSGN